MEESSMESTEINHGSIETHAGMDGPSIRDENFSSPKQEPFFSIKPGDHLDVDDFSGKSKWYWDKDVPGDGDRPDWLPEGSTVSDLARRAEGLRKQIGQIKHAPSEYSLDIDPAITEIMGITKDDPLIEEFKIKALGADISQEGFNELLNMYLEHQAGVMLSQMDAQESQFAEYGIDADETFDHIQNWANNNLSNDEAEILSNMSLSAPQMKVIQGIIRRVSGHENIAGAVTENYISREQQLSEVQKLMNGGIGSLERLNKLYGIS